MLRPGRATTEGKTMKRPRLKMIIVVLVGLVATTSAADADTAWRTLCIGQGQHAYAGCVLRNGKRLAFCMPRDRAAQQRLREGRVALVFRIASPKGRIEMIFPAGRAGAFHVRTHRFVRGHQLVISFRRGVETYRYERGMFGGQDATPENVFHGLKIFRRGRRISRQTCAGRRS